MGELEALAADEDKLFGQEDKEEGPLQWFLEQFGWVLVADVFFIIFLSTWFALGAFAAYVLQDQRLLTVFVTYWDPYFQAILGVLFGARLLAYILFEVIGMGKDENS